ncbi:serine/threonine protein kinase [Malassezia vespertilionis]|uniref:serine/threonine protein kinase n=1 Tax=Malassezia vespertilionis TaxID=2020962 RepID=UPI0024B2609A|nr:serine/threonine protein kinase [Malassezia vespertilionis]WFD08166.1 serine/threonine protein kinase [Malassezia vespertilionis]
MPLEHFGPSFSQDTARGSPGAPRAESELGLGRTAAHVQDARERDPAQTARMNERRKSGSRDLRNDDAILSKLAGVSRSVSWGRATCHAEKERPHEMRMERTPSQHGTLRRNYSHNRRIPCRTSSLSMPSGFNMQSIPKSQDDELGASYKSSPASSTALSLRSLSSLGAAGQDSRTPVVREQDKTTRLDGATVNEILAWQVSKGERRCSADASALQPAITQVSKALPPMPVEGDLRELPPIPGKLCFEGALPCAASIEKEGCELGRAGEKTAHHIVDPSLEMPSSSPYDLASFSSRRHASSFQRRPSLTASSTYASTASLGADDTPGQDVSQDSRVSRTRLTRLFSRLFLEQRSQSVGARGSSPLPESTSRCSSPPLAAPATVAPLQLASAQVHPRPVRSTMVHPPLTHYDLHDDNAYEIHGLTLSATPVRGLSPTSTCFPSGTSLNLAAPAASMPPIAPVLETHAEKENERMLDSYEVKAEIGGGTYGFVYRAVDKNTDEAVVIKYIVKNSILADSWRRHRFYGTIPTEIFVVLQLQSSPYVPPATAPPWILHQSHWMRMQQDMLASHQTDDIQGHPGICKLIDFFEDDEYYYMVMPLFGDGQDLFDFVESAPYGLDPRDVRSFLGQVADAIAFMHENGIVHRDIKDENVILDKFGMVQLIDFGSAARTRPHGKFDTFSGTVDCAAAEIIQGESYAGPPQDVWAFGVLAYVLICGECPFRDAQEAIQSLASNSRPLQVLQHYCFDERAVPQSGVHPRPQALEENASSAELAGGADLRQAYDLVVQCLQLDPELRPPAAQITQHRFITGPAGWTGCEGWRT